MAMEAEAAQGEFPREAALRRAGLAHGLSEGAVVALWEALARGGGRQAQFSHPDLGGMGQWSGGMVQIGDMFNAGLKARVMAACADLADAMASMPRGAARPATGAVGPATGAAHDWWPDSFGRPAASGSQNGLSYAYFPERRRLAVSRDGCVTLYDTGLHRIFGVSQAQSRGQHLAFTGEVGTVDLDSLAVVDA